MRPAHAAQHHQGGDEGGSESGSALRAAGLLSWQASVEIALARRRQDGAGRERAPAHGAPTVPLAPR